MHAETFQEQEAKQAQALGRCAAGHSCTEPSEQPVQQDRGAHCECRQREKLGSNWPLLGWTGMHVSTGHIGLRLQEYLRPLNMHGLAVIRCSIMYLMQNARGP